MCGVSPLSEVPVGCKHDEACHASRLWCSMPTLGPTLESVVVACYLSPAVVETKILSRFQLIL